MGRKEKETEEDEVVEEVNAPEEGEVTEEVNATGDGNIAGKASDFQDKDDSDQESPKKKNKKAKNQIDMTKGPIMKKMLIFAIPIILSNMLQLAFNAADVIVVGRFGTENSLAAVGSTAPFVNLLINLFIGLSIGSNVLSARYLGSRDESSVQKTLHTSIALSIVGGIGIAILGALICVPALRAMNAPDDILPLSAMYLRIFFIGLPANMLYNFGNAILRAKGDTRRPLVFLMISGAVNVALNLLFVIVFHMDVAGVAAATSISNFLSAILMIRCLMKEEGAFKLHIREIRFDRFTLVRISEIGIPAGFTGVLFAATNILIQASINSFGNIVMAASAAASNIENFVYFAMNAFYQAAVSFTGQNAGAGKNDRIRMVMWRALLCVTVVGLVMGISAYIFGNTLVAIYDTRAIVIREGVKRLMYISVFYAIGGAMDVLMGVSRGLGYSIGPMLITLLGTCVMRIAWIMLVLHIPMLYCIENVYVAYPVSWFITVVVEAFYLRHILKKHYPVEKK